MAATVKSFLTSASSLQNVAKAVIKVKSVQLCKGLPFLEIGFGRALT